MYEGMTDLIFGINKGEKFIWDPIQMRNRINPSYTKKLNEYIIVKNIVLGCCDNSSGNHLVNLVILDNFLKSLHFKSSLIMKKYYCNEISLPPCKPGVDQEETLTKDVLEEFSLVRPILVERELKKLLQKK